MPKPPSRTAPDARLADADLAPLDDSVHIWPGREVTVKGGRIYIRTTPTDAPDAEPVLCVHGLGGSAHNWTDFAGVLRNRLSIESIDLPGYGRSGPAVGNNYSLQAMADTVIGYLEQSDRGPVHLVGNSMGGAISILVASQRPELIRTLTLVSPAVPDNRRRIYPLRYNPRMALLFFPLLGGIAMRKMAGLPARTRTKATIALCFADATRYPEARLAEAVAEVEERASMPWANKAFTRSLRGLASSQFFRGKAAWQAMQSIEAPTLVLWGDTDRLVAPDLAPYVAAAIPESRLLVMKDIGHTAMMENPVDSARAMIALLDDAAEPRPS